MNKSDYIVTKIITFFKDINEGLKNKILDSFEFTNRKEKRKFDKIKDNNEKISNMLRNSLIRKRFFYAAYSAVNEEIPFGFDVKYYEIISSINEENKVFYVIFFFRWCYENGEDDVCNYKYFSKFVDSEIFDNILNHRTIVKNYEALSDRQELDKQGIELSDDFVDELNINSVIENEVKTMKLLGRIEQRNTFYNFFPQYKFVDGRFIEISSDDLKSEYPTSGSINLAYSMYSKKSNDFLKDEIKADLDRDLFVKTIYLVEIDNYDLEENDNDIYKVRLDLEKLSRAKSLNKIIKNSNNVEIYKVVESELLSIDEEVFASRLIFINGDNVVEGEKVVLLYKNKYYGPFKVNLRLQDGKFYIKTNADEKNYLISYYTENSIEKLEFEKQAHYENPHYTNFIHIIGDMKYEDVITDETLLEKIKDDISIELAVTNPKEFVRKCKNSPFFSDDNITDKRIQRLKLIITKANTFNEEKRKIFEMLLALYQKQSSEITDKTIVDSDLYKDLYVKYNEERRKNDDNEIEIQKLIKEKESLYSKINNLHIKSNDVVSSEQISQYENEIAELKEKLEKAEAIKMNIDQLQSEQKKLEINNEYLSGKAREYEEKILSAQEEVGKAIQNGIEDTANIAFEPFISSAMLKAAARWDTNMEIESYNKYKEKLSAITPSVLSGNDIVTYIVKYVQERRKYSYNEVVNIYINIAQNFITIFSGEPGTGKTSMCSIIAETLGLLNYGDDINRFVSVSVERGWSSKRDFIGYFNPLTKKYDKSNSKVYDALMKLDAEKDDSNYPFFIMLDEANLSPIEYYWADFMRLTDRSSSNDSYINIGTDKELYVPETLRFVATINTDQTTESLSPRLIDRACIIKLPKVDPITPSKLKSDEIISWDSFYKAFSVETDLSSATLKILKEIYSLFNNYGMNVSPRIQIGIEKYIRVAQSIMIEEDGAITSEIAIDYAVIQKLLPKINGLYLTYERFFDTMKQLCKEYHLNMTNNAIEKMIDEQRKNMGYCQYLI